MKHDLQDSVKKIFSKNIRVIHVVQHLKCCDSVSFLFLLFRNDFTMLCNYRTLKHQPNDCKLINQIDVTEPVYSQQTIAELDGILWSISSVKLQNKIQNIVPPWSGYLQNWTPSMPVIFFLHWFVSKLSYFKLIQSNGGYRSFIFAYCYLKHFTHKVGYYILI